MNLSSHLHCFFSFFLSTVESSNRSIAGSCYSFEMYRWQAALGETGQIKLSFFKKNFFFKVKLISQAWTQKNQKHIVTFLPKHQGHNGFSHRSSLGAAWTLLSLQALRTHKTPINRVLNIWWYCHHSNLINRDWAFLEKVTKARLHLRHQCWIKIFRLPRWELLEQTPSLNFYA